MNAGKLVLRLLPGAAALCALFAYAGYPFGPVFAALPARPGEHRPLAVAFFSGDMGARIGMGPGIIDRLNDAGFAVVSVNTLSFLARRKTPRDMADLVSETIRRARQLGGTGRVVLVGQSLGADLLHVALARLPEAERRAVALAIYVVPGATVEYRSSPGELFTFLTEPEYPALPTARAVDWLPVRCIYGIEEGESLCRQLSQRNVTAYGLPGGHLLGFDTAGLSAAIEQAISCALPGLHHQPAPQGDDMVHPAIDRCH